MWCVFEEEIIGSRLLLSHKKINVIIKAKIWYRLIELVGEIIHSILPQKRLH
jgi:hypothetical protein